LRVWDKSLKTSAGIQEEPRIHYPILGYYKTGTKALEQLLQNGNPLSPVLVEIPENPGVLAHPINLPPAFSSVFFINAVKNRKRMIVISACYTTAAILLGLIWESFAELTSVPAILTATMFLYLSLDYYSVFRGREDLAERCTYYGWIFSRCRPYLITAIVFFIASGITQFILGGDDYLDQFGMYFDLPDNQYYRILTGSLVHSQAAHYLTNFSFAIAVSAICGPSLRMSFVPLFLIGGTVSFGMTLLIEPYLNYPDSLGLVGTSGSIAALLGGLMVLIVKNPASYPKGLFYTITFFFTLGLVICAFFDSIISLSCHLFGAAAGLIWGLFLPDYLSSTTTD
jgi:membrane associated rhomboid family serine protease|tara:strand:+ start:748 stop:1770 length:1023 start_codon:yes stop_codon:yes gene_type:complete